MQKNPIHSAPVRAYNVVAPDGTVVSSWDYHKDAAEDLRDNKAAYPAGCRILTEDGLRRFKAHRSAPVRAYNVVEPDGTVVSSWDYREDAAEDLRDNKAAYPAGCRILTERGLRRFKAHLAGDLGALNQNPGGAKQRARGTRTVSPQKHHTRSWQQQHERYMRSAAASRRSAAAQPLYDHHGEQPRDAHIMRADEHRFSAKQIREQSRPYAFQLRSESGNSASFQSHAEALKWAESNLKKGEFFTISKDSDHFHEHYVKE